MAIADIDMSSCNKGPLCLGYNLLKFGTNWMSFATACQFITQFKGHLNFCIFGYYKAIIARILTHFFVFI